MDSHVYSARRGDLFYYCNGCTHLSYTAPGVQRMNVVVDVMFTVEAARFLFPPGEAGSGEVDGLPTGSMFARVPQSEVPCEFLGLAMPPPQKASQVQWMSKAMLAERPPVPNAVYNPADAVTFEFFEAQWGTRWKQGSSGGKSTQL